MELGDGTIIKDNQAFRSGQQIDIQQFLRGSVYGDVTIKRMTFTNGQTIDGYVTPGQELLFYLDTQTGPQAAVVVLGAARKPAAEATPQRLAVDTEKEVPKTGTPATGVPATGTPVAEPAKPVTAIGTNAPGGQKLETATLDSTTGADKGTLVEPKLGGFSSDSRSGGAEMLGLVPPGKTKPLTLPEPKTGWWSKLNPETNSVSKSATTPQDIPNQKITLPPRIHTDKPKISEQQLPQETKHTVTVDNDVREITTNNSADDASKPPKLTLASREYIKYVTIQKFIEDRGVWRFLAWGKYWDKGHTITLNGVTYEVKAINHQFGAYSAAYRPVGNKDWIWVNLRDE